MLFFRPPPSQSRLEKLREVRNQLADAVSHVAEGVRLWRRPALVFNVAKWKRPLVRRYLREYNIRFMALKDDPYERERWILLARRPLFIVWGRTVPDRLREFSIEHGIDIHHIEDGFVRSIGLGAGHIPPYSLCVDRTGIYYDSSCPSDLENILNTYNFETNPSLIYEARRLMGVMRASRLSKYNETQTQLASLLYGPKVKTRILVVGQVEDDQSLLYGCARIMSNVQLIQLAARENPDAQIIYKPHPDVMAGHRKEISDPTKWSHLVEILKISLTLTDALEGVDRVYTLTSLAGFEALLHGVAVTTVGAPFYAGWGLTDDRQPVPRRTRRLSLEAVFAAAYILYPRYMNPETRTKSSLSEVLEIFQEKLSEVEVVTPEKALDRIRPLNYATGHGVDPRFLYNSTSTNIAVIADEPEALALARAMVPRGKQVTFISTRDALANDERMLIAPEEREHILITSMHKRYGVAMSIVERESVELTRTFADSLRLALTEAASQHLTPDLIEALCFGLEDFIYYEALRFYGARECLKEFDHVLIVLKNVEVNGDLPRSVLFHARAGGDLGKVYLTLVDQPTKPYLTEIGAKSTPILESPQDLAELRTNFSRLWWSLQDSKYNDYASHGAHIAACGNVASENYAYSPASLKLLEQMEENSDLPVIFYNSGLLPAVGQEEIKSITLKGGLSSRCTVYNGHLARFRKKYPEEIQAMVDLFDDGLRKRVIELSRQRLPEDFIGIFQPRLEKYVSSLFAQIVFVAEAGQAMDKAVLFGTAMERNATSRLLTALARARKVPTIGVQPQIISTSPRYQAPAVDVMAVIDTAQVTTFERLGAAAEKLESVGSVNIINRLRMMDEAAAERPPPDGRSIFFAMQHSNPFEMIQTSLALRDICERRGYTVIVKPHPHQELPILNEVRSIFAGCSFAKVVNRDGDTYEAVARCAIVVGLFSSVLLECSIWGKPVIVAAFRDLEKSIDFSQQGLALKALNTFELDALLEDFVADGPRLAQLCASQQAYLQLNPQFAKPYSTARLDSFVARHVRAAHPGRSKK